MLPVRSPWIHLSMCCKRVDNVLGLPSDVNGDKHPQLCVELTHTRELQPDYAKYTTSIVKSTQKYEEPTHSELVSIWDFQTGMRHKTANSSNNHGSTRENCSVRCISELALLRVWQSTQRLRSLLVDQMMMTNLKTETANSFSWFLSVLPKEVVRHEPKMMSSRGIWFTRQNWNLKRVKNMLYCT